jgi:hypothetical protein
VHTKKKSIHDTNGSFGLHQTSAEYNHLILNKRKCEGKGAQPGSDPSGPPTGYNMFTLKVSLSTDYHQPKHAWTAN